MAELARRIAAASAHADPAWTAEREARVRAGVGRGLERKRRKRVGLVVGIGTCTLLLGFLLGRLGEKLIPTARLATADQQGASLLQLPDGSTVTARSSDAHVETLAVSPEVVVLRLETGAARFSVTPNPKRPFRVVARDVTVTVLGTIFSVSLEPSGVRVGVERGRVRVDSPHERRVLNVGDTQSFASPSAHADANAPQAPPADAEPEMVADPLPVAVDPLPPVEEAPARPAATLPSWRALAKEQNYSAAFARLNAEGPNAVRDTPDDLLLAADVARLGGRPDRAVAPLQRVIADHPFDPRAPLAAFTLGRTLLEQLGRPRDAAQAFATARRLDRGGALTQDALAREVESWSGAGDGERAHARALEYVKLYPHGRRISAVRRLGGLD
jgi:transmembrane sensor